VGPAPPGLEDLADYVLDEFSPEERHTITELLDPMSEAVEAWLQEGIEVAMNRFNR
jgi:peptidyl-tRNA hydrolase, PTH1 family